MIENKILINISRSAIILIVLFAAISSPAKRAQEINYIEPLYPVDYSNDEVLIGASHHVFVGKIKKQLNTINSPVGVETRFEVEILENIKGNLKGNITLNQGGGYDEKGVLHIVDGDLIKNSEDKNYLLQEGSTYVLAVRSSGDFHKLNPHSNARKLITREDNLSKAELKDLVKKDERVLRFEKAYPKEKLLDADVKNNKTLNKYKK